MLGAFIGDMEGSIYEFSKVKPKINEINLFSDYLKMTDDSLLTIAIFLALKKNLPFKVALNNKEKLELDVKTELTKMVKSNPVAGYGYKFLEWAYLDCLVKDKKGYGSFGNGGAMRVSSVPYLSSSLEECEEITKIVTNVTHNSIEGVNGALALSTSIYLILKGKTKEEIKEHVIKNYYPDLDKLDYLDLVNNFTFNSRASLTVDKAIYMFLISDSEISTIKNSLSIGGDTDTITSMALSLSEPYYNKESLSEFDIKFIKKYLNTEIMLNLMKEFYSLANIDKFKNFK